MSIPITEQETTISYSRDSGNCNIWTCDSTTMTKLDKIYPCTKVHKSADGEVWAKEYTMSKRLLSFRTDKAIVPNNPPARKLSDKQKAVLQKMREQRQKSKRCYLGDHI